MSNPGEDRRRKTETRRVDGVYPKKDRAAYMREYSRTEKNKAWRKKYNRARYEKDKYRIAARMKVRDALISGDLVKPLLCQECNIEERLEGHHHDYSKPLVVNWLCIDCHKALHRKINKETGHA